MIVRTLDHPGLSALPPERKARAAYDLLATVPTLLILDNAETIGDPALLPWLLALPTTTRVLVTTRQMDAAYLASERVRVLPLQGLTGPESRRLIREHARFIDLRHAQGAEAQQALIERTGGCPQAIKQLLGYARGAGQSLQEVPLG